MNDLMWLDAHELAALVRTGEAHPIELVDAAINRIEQLDTHLNAVVHRRFEAARADAAGDLPDGPFRGVPIVLKDLYTPSAGDPMHNGTRFLRDAGWRATEDAAVVSRLRRAGFVILGKTNVPELGAGASTEPLAYGPTRNPWNTAHSAGGSSGGSAAAVAAGLVPVAHANDGGGSLRIPASECGLVGLKPTRARVSQAPAGVNWAIGCACEGVLTRTVRDTAAILDAIAGGEPGDPFPAPALDRPLAAEVGADPGRLRVGVLDRPPLDGVPADPDTQVAVRATADLLASLGHDVVEGFPHAYGDPEFLPTFAVLMAAGLAAEIERWEEVLGHPVADDLEPNNAAALAAGRGLSAAQHARAIEWMHNFQRRMATWWAGGFDLLLTPVLNATPPPIGWLGDPDHGRDRVRALWQYTAQFNATGQPAISLPLHWNDAGLPVGIQLVAAYGREDVLVRVAAQLEQAAPWARRRPFPQNFPESMSRWTIDFR